MRINARFGIAAMAAVCVAGFATITLARADDTSDHISRATAKLNDIDKLIDGINARNGGSVAVSAPTGGAARTGRRGARQAAAVKTLKCDACGMEMSTKSSPNFRAVKIKGTTYYCCKGCDMSKQVDKE
jgi:hypothetical protein